MLVDLLEGCTALRHQNAASGFYPLTQAHVAYTRSTPNQICADPAARGPLPFLAVRILAAEVKPYSSESAVNLDSIPVRRLQRSRAPRYPILPILK